MATTATRRSDRDANGREILTLRTPAGDQDGVANAIDRGERRMHVGRLGVVEESDAIGSPRPRHHDDAVGSIVGQPRPSRLRALDAERQGAAAAAAAASARYPARSPSIRPEPASAIGPQRRARRRRSRPRRLRRADAEPHDPTPCALARSPRRRRRRGSRRGRPIAALLRVDPRLRVDVGLEGTVPVEMIGRDVEQDRDTVGWNDVWAASWKDETSTTSTS